MLPLLGVCRIVNINNEAFYNLNVLTITEFGYFFIFFIKSLMHNIAFQVNNVSAFKTENSLKLERFILIGISLGIILTVMSKRLIKRVRVISQFREFVVVLINLA